MALPSLALKVTPASATRRRSCWIFFRFSRCRLARKSAKSAYGSGSRLCQWNCTVLRMAQPASRAAAWSASSRKSRWADDISFERASCSMAASSANRCSGVPARSRGPGTGVKGIASSNFG